MAEGQLREIHLKRKIIEMAKLISGAAMSHIPPIGAASDNGKTQDPYYKPLFDGFEPARKWMRDTKPDTVIIIYNDHASAFSVDLINTFVLGVGEEFEPHDEGYGPRKVPTGIGNPELAEHMLEHLIMNDFDLALANEMTVDHGFTVPLTTMCGAPDEWPCKVIPLCVNVIKYPQPKGSRCFALGKEIRRAIDSYDSDETVAIWGTGGMSHQLQGERAGFINEEFDTMFLDKLGPDPESLARIPHIDYLRDAGSEGIELIMWLIMRGAMKSPKEVYRNYHVPMSNTAAGLICYDEQQQ